MSRLLLFKELKGFGNDIMRACHEDIAGSCGPPRHPERRRHGRGYPDLKPRIGSPLADLLRAQSPFHRRRSGEEPAPGPSQGSQHRARVFVRHDAKNDRCCANSAFFQGLNEGGDSVRIVAYIEDNTPPPAFEDLQSASEPRIFPDPGQSPLHGGRGDTLEKMLAGGDRHRRDRELCVQHLMASRKAR